MSDRGTRSVTRYLPLAIVTTAVVGVLPVAAVWVLRAEGVISSWWVCLAVAIGLGLALSTAGAAVWKRRPASGDLMFSELMLWGWVRRLRIERHDRDAWSGGYGTHDRRRGG